MDSFRQRHSRESDLRNEGGYKIEAKWKKLPLCVIGTRNGKGTVAVRSRSKGDLGAMKTEDFKAMLLKEIREKAF